MASVAAMQKWYEVWRKEPATAIALREFNKIKKDDDVRGFDITHERIAVACFNAAHYRKELDPGEIYRANIAAEKKKLKQLRKAVHILALSAGRNEKGLVWGSLAAELESGVRVTRKEHHEPKAYHLVLQDYFSHLETALKGPLPELHGGPWRDKFTKGNLIYDKPISRGNKVSTETMLAFELAFYLRMYTAGRAEDSLQNGQRMPNNDDGEPCFPIVAEFCSAVFNNSFDAKELGDKVRDLRNVGLATDWQGVNSD